MKTKTYLILVSTLAIALGLGVSLLYLTYSPKNYGHVGLAVTFQTLEDLASDADVVLIGHINAEYTKREVKESSRTRIDQLYNVKVEKIIYNKYNVEVEDNINLLRATNFIIGTSVYDLVEVKEIESGKYLLFLNQYKDDLTNKSVFVNNTPNHLYIMDHKTMSFKNLVEESGVLEIQINKLEQVINEIEQEYK